MIRPNKVVPQIKVYDLSLYDKDRSFFIPVACSV